MTEQVVTTQPDARGAVGDGSSPGITAIITCYNEAAAVERAYRLIKAELDRYGDVELLFVDDGSTDATLDRVKGLAAADPCIRYLAFSRNFGLEAAFTAGFKYASKALAVQFDADLQAPPAEAHKLIAKALEGYDAVFGVRRQRRDPWWRRAGSRGQQWVARRLLGIEMPVGASTSRAVWTAVARKVGALELPLPYFIATIPRLTGNWTTVPTEHAPRRHGRSRFRPGRLVGHTMDLFLGFSYRPLLLVAVLAAAGAAVAVPALALAAAGRLGLTVLGALGLALTALTLVGLAVVAGYVFRLAEGHRRPARFYVREANIPVAPEDDLYGHAGAHGDRRPAPDRPGATHQGSVATRSSPLVPGDGQVPARPVGRPGDAVGGGVRP